MWSSQVQAHRLDCMHTWPVPSQLSAWSSRKDVPARSIVQGMAPTPYSPSPEKTTTLYLSTRGFPGVRTIGSRPG